MSAPLMRSHDGSFSLRVVQSLHSALNHKHYFDPSVIPRDARVPLKFHDLIEGGSLCHLVRLGGHQILTFGSMNYIEREMEGLRPDVALVGANRGRLQIHDYTGRLMRALGFPRLVIPTHWDNLFLPYAAIALSPAVQRPAASRHLSRVLLGGRAPSGRGGRAEPVIL